METSKFSFERENNLQSAYDLWLDIINEQRLQYIIKDHSVNEFRSSLCYLCTKEDIFIRGAGKGITLDEISISAKYEALEYYFSGSYYYPQDNIVADLDEIIKNFNLLAQRMNITAFLKEAQYHSKIPWLIYKEYKSGKKYALPLACADLSYYAARHPDDTFDYTKCHIYASSNGVASGSSFNEALVHAILELMERDAYSYFLIDTFLLKKVPLIINKKTLPNDLQELIKSIENKYHNKIILIKMPSNYNIETYLAIFEKSNFQIRPRGSGASLISRHAVERAVTELLQSYNLMHGNYDTYQINKQRLNKNTLIKSFLKLNITEHFKGRSFLTEFQPNSIDFSYLKLSEYLNELIELIDCQSSSLLVNIAYQNDKGFTCLRASIPEVEEFFLATHYLKLEPKNKTKNYIKNHLKKEFSWNDY